MPPKPCLRVFGAAGDDGLSISNLGFPAAPPVLCTGSGDFLSSPLSSPSAPPPPSAPSPVPLPFFAPLRSEAGVLSLLSAVQSVAWQLACRNAIDCQRSRAHEALKAAHPSALSVTEVQILAAVVRRRARLVYLPVFKAEYTFGRRVSPPSNLPPSFLPTPPTFSLARSPASFIP